jgi:hypothetical protein
MCKSTTWSVTATYHEESDTFDLMATLDVLPGSSDPLLDLEGLKPRSPEILALFSLIRLGCERQLTFWDEVAT